MDFDSARRKAPIAPEHEITLAQDVVLLEYFDQKRILMLRSPPRTRAYVEPGSMPVHEREALLTTPSRNSPAPVEPAQDQNGIAIAIVAAMISQGSRIGLQGCRGGYTVGSP